MNKLLITIISLSLLITVGCSTSTAPADTQANIQTSEQLPTNTLILPIDNSAPLYYTADEITKLSSCALRAKQAEIVAQEKLDGKTLDQIKIAHADDKNTFNSQTLIDQAFSDAFYSKNDFALKVFKSCAISSNMTDERVSRASFCMSSQFFVEYIWMAKQHGASEKDVRHQLADSANKAVPLIVREIYNHDAESLDNARARLWDNCIYNFKQLK